LLSVLFSEGREYRNNIFSKGGGKKKKILQAEF